MGLSIAMTLGNVLGLLALSLLFVCVFLRLLSWLLLPKDFPLKGKHVVIVGGSSGIGLAMAQIAVLEGAKVTVLSRQMDRLKDAKRSLEDLINLDANMDSPVCIHSVDVSEAENTKNAIESAISQFGGVDVLVCSQGVSRPMRFDQTPDSVLHEVMDTNYWGCVHAIRCVLPSMKASSKPKRIALVGSQAGQVGVYGYANYGATKFALRGLAEALQQELAPYNIRMTLVYPPDTDTPLLNEENKTKHPVTKLLSESSAMVSPSRVAKGAIMGIKSGLFNVPCNFDGYLLGIVTAGMSPQPSLGMAVLEVLTMGVLRIVAFAILGSWFGIIRKWHKDNRNVHSAEKTKDA